MRLIDADALKDRLNFCVTKGLGGRIAFTFIHMIDEQPTVEPMQWIPVAKRLPKKDGDYLVTTYSGQIARYIFIGGSSEEYWRRCATAWMPLPKPYGGDADGNL